MISDPVMHEVLSISISPNKPANPGSSRGFRRIIIRHKDSVGDILPDIWFDCFGSEPIPVEVENDA